MTGRDLRDIRKDPRLALRRPVTFTVAKKSSPGKLANLSVGGAFISARRHPDEDSLTDLSLDLPSPSRPVDLAARVTRIEGEAFGVEFVSLDSAHVEILWSFIAGHLKPEGACPHCGVELGETEGDACPSCAYPLHFEDPLYFEKRDAAAQRHHLVGIVREMPRESLNSAGDLLSPFLYDTQYGDAEKRDQEMIGTCRKMKEVFRLIRKIATVDVPVLIVGETGTGKEMAARAIHERSLRRAEPFIPINCGAIPGELLESELFGYERGAFTGAEKQVRGRIEYAAGGSLFLDEIGELPLDLQVKLLRFLNDFRIERVGGRESIEVDLRILAASNGDLRKGVAHGSFRKDLYYRLNVIEIVMPPLRERGEDAVIMAEAFLRQYARTQGNPIKGFTRDALAAIRSHSWPGNVRELINLMRRAIVLTEQGWITPENLGLTVKPHSHEGLKEATSHFQREIIEDFMDRFGGKVTDAAKALKVSRSEMYYLLKKHGISRARDSRREEALKPLK